jgi:hypothetical protein
MAARGDKTAKDRFETWLEEKRKNRRYAPPLHYWQHSQLQDARWNSPYELFYFLLNLLQDMLIEFSKVASTDASYVKYLKSNVNKCPPSIIGLMIYYQAPSVLVSRSKSIYPAPDKQRIYDSEIARAGAQACGSTKPNMQDPDSQAWDEFDAKVMQHLIWPAVLAGKITSAPKASIDSPEWWSKMLPILEDEKVYGMFSKGGKKRSRMCWDHICCVLEKHTFQATSENESYKQPTVQ